MKTVLLSLMIVLTGHVFGHKYYVSIAELQYNTEKERIEGSLKLTAHDFEQILENKFDERIHLEDVADSSRFGLYIQSYLMDHFKLFSEGKEATPTFIGKEVTLRQELFFYFTFSNIVNPKKIKLINTVLFELFPKQQNIIHYKYKERTKSVTLVPSKTTDTINFD